MRASLVAAEQQRSAGDDAAIEPGSPQEYARRADWDLLSAWIDVFAAKRLFHRGSGERHRVQLSTLPAFQGYSLQVGGRDCCLGGLPGVPGGWGLPGREGLLTATALTSECYFPTPVNKVAHPCPPKLSFFLS